MLQTTSDYLSFNAVSDIAFVVIDGNGNLKSGKRISYAYDVAFDTA